ncbi:MAG: hypothetical protein WD801_14060 [Gemmatimonadaceae bacterium]
MSDHVAQPLERSHVRLATRAQEHVARTGSREHVQPREFAQLTLQPVAVHGGVAVLRHHDRHAHMPSGSVHPANVEHVRSHPLPGAQELFDLGLARYPASA